VSADRFGGLAAAAVLIFAPLSAPAQDYWQVQTGDWSIASNWNGGLPTNSVTAVVANGGTAGISQVAETCNALSIGSSAASGTVQMTGGNLSASNENVGDTGTGTFTQFGGANSIGSTLYLGANAGGSGTYNLSGNGMVSMGFAVVGNSGVGTFMQSGGATSIGTELFIGENAGSSGVYNLSGNGFVSAGYAIVGNSGVGTLTQSGGTDNISTTFSVGYGTGGSGTYNLSGNGYVSAEGENVGLSGTGTFTQSGGTNSDNISYNLNLGANAGSTGSYNLGGNGVVLAGTEVLGYSGTGTFTQSGGTNSISISLRLGYVAGSSGTYNLNGGVLVVPSLSQGAGSSTFNFNGGTLRASNGLSTSQPMTLGTSGGGATFDTAGYPATISGTLSGPGSLSKVDTGTLTLAAANTYSGATIVNGGTLLLSGSLNPGSPLAMGGGSFILTRASSQALAGLTVNTGASGISVVAGGTLALGAIGRNFGGGMDFNGNATGTITTISANTDGILGPWATYGSGASMQYAAASGAVPYKIVPYSSATAITSGLAGLIDTSGTANYTLSGGGGTLAAAVASNTLEFTGPATTITASNTDTLSLNGIMNVAAGTATITGGQFLIGSSQELVVTGPGNVTIAAAVVDNAGGACGVTVLGPGKLTLAATDTFSGSTVLDGGTLAIGSALALQQSTLNVNGGNPIFGSVTSATFGGLSGSGTLSLTSTAFGAVALSVGNDNASTTYFGTLQGTGSLTKIGSGSLVFTGSNTYTASTTITAGTLQIGNGGSGAAIGSTSGVSDNASLIFNHADAVTLNANISGTGALTQAGAGTLTLTQSNTYTGATTITAGALQIGIGGTGASIGSTSGVTDSGGLIFNHGDAVVFSPIISGSGSLTQTGSGILVLTNGNSYNGLTTISGGTLQVDNGGSSGAVGSGPVTNNAALVFDRSGSGFVVYNVISGSGSLAQFGLGMLTLGATNLYTGNTFISTGTLALGNGLAIQNSTLVTSPSGVLCIDGLTSATFGGLSSGENLVLANTAGTPIALSVGGNNSNTTYSGELSDNGAGASLTKLGSGSFTLTGLNTYTGPTTITGGTLQIGNGTTDGSIASSSGIIDNSTLAYNLVGSQSYGNVISGSGKLYKTGGGTLTLTGSNTYSGPTIVNGGSLIGSVASLPSAITLANSANVTLNLAVSGTYSQTISGSGGLILQGPGGLTLTGSNSYNGGTVIQGGTVKVTNTSALGPGPITLAGGVLSLACTTPFCIGIQFVGNGNPLTGSAGVVPMSNWNSLGGYGYINTPLSDSSRAATPATLTTNGGYRLGSTGSSNQLLSGFLESNNSQLSATLSGIPYANYSLYAYSAFGNSGYGETMTIGGSNYYFVMTNSASYAQVTNSNSGSFPVGNYVAASGLTGATQTITLQGVGQPYGALAGLEIVSTLPNPNAMEQMPNAVTLTSDATIDISATSNASVAGLLTIGSNRLSVTGGVNTAYSLSLGSSGGVLLSGNPTFDVANNGSGPGTLVLGGLNDGGTARTITKTDSGALTLSTAAIAMNAGDIVNVNGGTLNSSNAAALGTLTAVNVAAGATFTLGASQTLGGLGDAGTAVINSASVVLNSNGLTVGSGNNLSSTFSGTIADGTGGPGSLIKAGTGSLVLCGSNSYSGGTTVNNGVLQMGSVSALGASGGPLTVNGGTLDMAGYNVGVGVLKGLAGTISSTTAATLTTAGNAPNSAFGGTLAGPISLIKAGTGGLLLSGANTYTGGTVVAAGTLEAASTGSLPGYTTAGTIIVGSGAMLAVSAGGNDWTAAGIGTLLGSNGGGFASGSTLGIDTSGGSLSFDTTISGSMGLAKLGGSSLILTGSNTYSGPTLLSAGTLQAAVASALPAGRNITFAGGTLQYGGSNTQDYSANIVDSTGPVAIDTNGANVTFATPLASSNSGGLTKIGDGTLVLATSNVFGGNTLISGGTLVLGDPGALQQSTLDTSGSGVLSFGILTSATLGGLTGPGTIVLSNATSAAVALSIGNNNAGTSFAGAMTGPGNVTKVGGGSLLLSGSNSYTGGTVVAAGTLEAASTASLSGFATPGTITVGSGATLAVSAGSNGWTSAGISTLLSSNSGGFVSGSLFGIDTLGLSTTCSANIAGAMGLATLGGNTLVLTGSNSYTGPTLVRASNILQIGNGGSGASIGGTSGVTDNGSLVFNHGDAVGFSSIISGSGSLTQTGSGILILTNLNSYSGTTFISGGTLQSGDGVTDGSIASAINNNAALVYNLVGSQSYGNVISGSGGVYKSGGGTLALTGNNTYSGLTTVNSGTLVGNTASLPGAIRLANNANVTFSQAANGVFYNAVSGSGSMTAQGPGVLTLAASSSYTAGTNIAGCALKVTDSSALGSGPVTLAGGTLSLAGGVPSIGVQFLGYQGIPIAGPAGAAPMNNWNILSGSSFSNTPLTDNSVATTTAQLTSSANGLGSTGNNTHLFSGYILNANMGPLPPSISATISGIPYANYSLYAYLGALGAGGTVSLGGSAYYYSTTSSASYVQVTNTTAGSYPAGNYVVASALTGGTQTVTLLGAYQSFGQLFSNSLSGLEIVDTAPTSASSPAWAMANAVTLSSDSTIDVTGPSNAAVTGLFTIGGNRLSVTGGGSGPNTAYSLTLGTSGGVLLTGNPTFDVANNGAGSGTLVLGALNDGGTARTINKTDSGALTLIAAASMMNAGDIVNVNGGTLNSNNATALGALTAVNLAAGTTLSLGAGQTVGALGDAGTVVVNSASVLLNGNALTVGSGNNLSSTFSGVIANGAGGAGGLTKAGTGALDLAGNNTYTGGTTVAGGTLRLGNANALGAGSLAANGGTLDLAGYSVTVGSFSGAAGTVANLGGTLATLTVNQLTSATFGGTLANGKGPLALIKAGSAALTLSGTNNYTGGTYVNAGTLIVDSANSLAGGSSLFVGVGASSLFVPPSWIAGSGNWSTASNWSSSLAPNGAGRAAALDQPSGSVAVNLDVPVTLGSLQFGNTGTGGPGAGYALVSGSTGPGLTFNNPSSTSFVRVLSGTHSIASPVVIASGNLDFAESNSGMLVIAGNIAGGPGTRGLTLNGDGSGRLVLSGSNTYTGGTIVVDGTLIVDSATALAPGSGLVVGQGSTLTFAPVLSAPLSASLATEIAAVPEPGTLMLFLGAVFSACMIGFLGWRRECRLESQL
jgi:fibronectin-binding autotransporter adhesin